MSTTEPPRSAKMARQSAIEIAIFLIQVWPIVSRPDLLRYHPSYERSRLDHHRRARQHQHASRSSSTTSKMAPSKGGLPSRLTQSSRMRSPRRTRRRRTAQPFPCPTVAITRCFLSCSRQQTAPTSGTTPISHSSSAPLSSFLVQASYQYRSLEGTPTAPTAPYQNPQLSLPPRPTPE